MWTCVNLLVVLFTDEAIYCQRRLCGSEIYIDFRLPNSSPKFIKKVDNSPPYSLRVGAWVHHRNGTKPNAAKKAQKTLAYTKSAAPPKDGGRSFPGENVLVSTRQVFHSSLSTTEISVVHAEFKYPAFHYISADIGKFFVFSNQLESTFLQYPH